MRFLDWGAPQLENPVAMATNYCGFDRVLRARQGLLEDPADLRLASNLANALWLQDALAEALTWALWATRASAANDVPVHSLAWRCLGNVLLDLGRFAEADLAYRRADPLERDHATQFNRSKVALGAANDALAWRLAEHRLLGSRLPDGAYPGPWWVGWPAVDAVTIWAEQGLGDTLQFLRWIPALVARGVSVRLLVQPPLQRVVARGLAWVGSGLLVEPHPGSALPRLHGCHGSLLSLPWLLEQPSTAWTQGWGYIRIPVAGRGSSTGRLRVGLVWAGGFQSDRHTRERDYRRKSVLGQSLRALLDGLLQLPVDLVGLQVGPDRNPPELEGVPWADVLDPQADVLSLAEQLMGIDLLLTVDTAAAHLAGAMGRPTWLLLPWAAASRWGRGSVATRWYPSLRLWRQPRHGDWFGLWPSVLKALREEACETGSDSP